MSSDCTVACTKCGADIICTPEETSTKFVCADCNGSAGPKELDFSDRELKFIRWQNRV